MRYSSVNSVGRVWYGVKPAMRSTAIETKALMAWFNGFVLFLLSLVISMGPGQTLQEARAQESGLYLADYTCGHGMHFDFKQGCVVDAPKAKNRMIRDQEHRSKRAINRMARLEVRGAPSQSRHKQVQSFL